MHAILKALVAGIATIRTVQAVPLSQNATPSSTTQPAATVNAKEQFFRDLLSAPTANKCFQRLFVQGERLVTGETLNPQPVSGAKGGVYKLANIETSPIVASLSISMAVGFFKPCGINTPHVHPRATEFSVLVERSNVKFGYILENGLVKPSQNPEIVCTPCFLKGSVHFQFNEACEKATFIAAFNSVDPGISQVAHNFFNLDAGVVNATLGFPRTINGSNIEEFRKAIAANLAQDIDNCLAKCRLQQKGE